MTASSSVVLSNLAYLIGAVVLAVIGGLLVWLRHRRPRSVDANVESFHRGLRALAPDVDIRPTGEPSRARIEPRPGGIEPRPGGSELGHGAAPPGRGGRRADRRVTSGAGAVRRRGSADPVGSGADHVPSVPDGDPPGTGRPAEPPDDERAQAGSPGAGPDDRGDGPDRGDRPDPGNPGRGAGDRSRRPPASGGQGSGGRPEPGPAVRVYHAEVVSPEEGATDRAGADAG